MNDFTFALRQMRKNVGLSAVVVISLALGIAANTTIFSVINTLLLTPPPVAEPGTLWQVWRFRPAASSAVKRYAVWSHPALAHLRTHNAAFSAIGGVTIEPVPVTWNRQGVGEAAQASFVTGNFFDLAGISTAQGRFFRPEEDQSPNTHPVVVVSHSFWKARMAADPEALGRSLSVNGVALTVIGVAPEAFTGVLAGVSPDLWLPVMMRPAVTHDPECLTRLDAHWLMGVGRLNAGVTPAQADAELTALNQGFEASLGGSRREEGAVLLPSYQVPVPLRGAVQAFTALLMGAVFLVLLIACANAANLLLARAAVRQSEWAVRSALGASRGRLLRQLLTESVLLAGLGGGLGLVLSAWLMEMLVRWVPVSLPLRFAVGIDGRVLAFTLVVSLATGVVFGLAPAWRGSRLDLAGSLRARPSGLGPRRSWFMQGLMVAQMALCVVLLTGAALCLRSLMEARAFNPGFIVENRVAARLNLGDQGFSPEQTSQFQARLLERVTGIPGVRSAAWTRHLPLGSEHSNGRVQLPGRVPPTGESGFRFEQFSVGPGYFATMGTPLLRGREFQAGDDSRAQRVAIINEEAAVQYWPGQDPIGQRIESGGAGPEHSIEIVGVVATGRYRTLGETPLPAFHTCFLQETHSGATLVLHIDGASGTVFGALGSAVREMDSRVVLTGVQTLEEHLSLVMFPLRVSGMVLGMLGLVALVLAVSGLFGVIAYAVSQNTREYGIRLALGARRGDVQWLVLRRGLTLAAIGIAIGCVGVLAAHPLLRSILWGVRSNDPVTLAAIPLVLWVVAGLACWLPARRASRLDPIVALRSE